MESKSKEDIDAKMKELESIAMSFEETQKKKEAQAIFIINIGPCLDPNLAAHAKIYNIHKENENLIKKISYVS